jgi:uncharacterized cofD-like protein
MKKINKIVILGGGTGTFGVVSAIKPLPVKISTVIAVSDSGGSTGRIRDEFGFQPVGDLRQSLAALADPHDQEWIQKILLYRFEKGNGLKGHNLGNLILTALQDMTGNTTRALEIAALAFDLRGDVIPVTKKTVDLQITYTDGTQVVGEHLLDENPKKPKEIARVDLVPNCQASPKAIKAIHQANFIIIGPGDFYASLMATLVVPGVKEAISKSKAIVIYISNLMTRFTQTHNLTAKGHTKKIEDVIGKKVDIIIINSGKINPKVVKHYAEQHEFPVINDFPDDSKQVLSEDLVQTAVVKKSEVDNTYRSLLRHDPKKLGQVLENILVAQ